LGCINKEVSAFLREVVGDVFKKEKLSPFQIVVNKAAQNLKERE
jgi:hypothetical protein